jgi:hypothetical protein
MPSVPHHTATIAADWSKPVGPGTIKLNINGSYRSAAASDFSQSSAAYFGIDAFSLWNGAISFVPERGHWKASLFLRNIFNARGVTGGLPASLVGPVSQGY